MEDSKKRSRYLVGLSEASPACDFRLALFVLARARVFACARVLRVGVLSLM